MSVTLKKVLISDAVDPLCVDLLKSHGVNVVTKFKLPKEQLILELQDADGLIVRSDTKVTKDVINSAPCLKVIGRAGTGVDNIDLDAATKRGIIVVNSPTGNSISACELTCALISSLARNVPQACQSLKEGRWDRKLYTGNELSGKVLAILGLGRIGREVARRMQSYGMRTIGFDPLVNAEDAKSFNVEKMELEEIWPLADYITVHTPLIPQTKNLINKTTLNKSKKGVNVINVARGGIVDEEALLEALKDGRCGGAALDVYIEEPPKCETTLELIKHPLVVATPHLGASTDEAQQRVAVDIAEQFVALSGLSKDGENFIVTGAVNAPVLSATMQKTNLPWINLTLLLGKFLGRYSELDWQPKSTVHLTTRGDSLKDKNFLTIPALAGILDQVKSGVNVISAPGFAKEAGLTIERSHEDGEESISVSVFGNTVSGTLGGNNAALLTSLNSLSFNPGAALEGNVNVFASPDKIDLTSLLAEIKKIDGDIANLSVAANKHGSIVIAHTVEPLTTSTAAKVEHYLASF